MHFPHRPSRKWYTLCPPSAADATHFTLPSQDWQTVGEFARDRNPTRCIGASAVASSRASFIRLLLRKTTCCALSTSPGRQKDGHVGESAGWCDMRTSPSTCPARSSSPRWRWTAAAPRAHPRPRRRGRRRTAPVAGITGWRSPWRWVWRGAERDNEPLDRFP